MSVLREEVRGGPLENWTGEGMVQGHNDLLKAAMVSSIESNSLAGIEEGMVGDRLLEGARGGGEMRRFESSFLLLLVMADWKFPSRHCSL